jgi:hypothetical protein
MQLNDDQWALVMDWMRKLHTLEYAHRYESIRGGRLNLTLGVPVVATSALSSAQVAMPGLDSTLAQALVGSGAAVVGVLAALLTFLKPAEVAEKHRAASFQYEALRHRLEFLLTFNQESNDLVPKLSRLKEEWEALKTPNVTTRTWTRAKARVTEVGTYPESLRLASVETAGRHPTGP